MGKITVVGIGPGSLIDMTERAKTAIAQAEVIVGYHTYIELIKPLIEGKNIIGTGMKQEVDRCKAAIDAALTQNVVVVSSGDSGVYGMAGLVLEMVLNLPKEERPTFDVIAGVSAVNAAAAVLGAPLMHDFAVISLSDLLTPWEVIVKRVECAAQADFVIALYNPKSHKRIKNIELVQQIILKYRKPSTPVGIVTGASRDNQSKIISTLENFINEEINMFSLVIIGNSTTFVKENYMITPRGYTL